MKKLICLLALLSCVCFGQIDQVNKGFEIVEIDGPTIKDSSDNRRIFVVKESDSPIVFNKDLLYLTRTGDYRPSKSMQDTIQRMYGNKKRQKAHFTKKYSRLFVEYHLAASVNVVRKIQMYEVCVLLFDDTDGLLSYHSTKNKVRVEETQRDSETLDIGFNWDVDLQSIPRSDISDWYSAVIYINFAREVDGGAYRINENSLLSLIRDRFGEDYEKMSNFFKVQSN